MGTRLRQIIHSVLLGIVLCCTSYTIVSSQSNAIDVEQIEFSPHAYYAYKSALVYDQIEVIEDPSGVLTIADIRSGTRKWSSNNSKGNLKNGRVYWAHLTFSSKRIDTLLLELGLERQISWDKIDYSVFHADSLILEGTSGNQYRPADKPLRSSLNLAYIPIQNGVTHLYCRLEGLQEIKNDPLWWQRFKNQNADISFYIHDRKTYPVVEAYRFPGYYTLNKRGHFFGANYFKQGIEVSTDPTKSKSVREIENSWDDLATFQYNSHPQPDSVYWLRFKVNGTDDGPGNYLFGPSSGTHWNFDTIKAYTKTKNGEWDIQTTGNKVRREDKKIKTDWNLFRVKVEPQDTQTIFLRLSGAGKRFVPAFGISHIDEDTFWPQLFTVQWIYGGFFSILITTAMYFLILGMLERRAVQFWFVGLIAGFGFVLAFLGADVNYFLFPSIENIHPWIAALGGFLLVACLYHYLKEYLELELVLGIRINNIIYPFIVFHLLICLAFAYQLYSVGGSIAIYEPYYRLFIASIVVNFLLALVIGVIMMVKGNPYAKFFVIAFGTLLIILLIRLAFAFGSFSGNLGFDQSSIRTGLFVHYLMFLGIIMMIILLAFGNGYRINQLKKSAVNAALKSQEKELANNFLRQNNEEIKKKAEENELLVKEIHHRVKNNLQVLASLLNLQSDFINDQSAYKAIMESKARVEAMGMIHQLLYLGNSGVPSIDMSLYLDELCSYYKESFISDDQDIDIAHEISVGHLDIDTAIPLGLTITELVTNAKKHAFGNDRSGSILIKLWINESDQLCLVVSDDGVGMHKSLDDKESKSFGTELIRILSRKLKGSISTNSSKGYQTSIIYDRYTHYPQPV